jgi:hypothetical protein
LSIDLAGGDRSLGALASWCHGGPLTKLKPLLEVVAQEASAGLLGCHGLSDFASDELETAFGVESQRGALDIGGTDDHMREAKLAGHILLKLFWRRSPKSSVSFCDRQQDATGADG